MSSKSVVAVRLAESSAKAPASRARKQFNTLVKKLEAERARLADWQETLPLLSNLATQEFPPLAQAYDAVQKQLVLLLDQAHGHKSMGKRNQDKLEGVICSITADLLESGDDEELALILQKYLGEEEEEEATDFFDDIEMLESLGARFLHVTPEAAAEYDQPPPSAQAKSSSHPSHPNHPNHPSRAPGNCALKRKPRC